MIRVRDGALPAAANTRRATRWCSFSKSIVVSTPSSRIPRSSHPPLTPVPVPTSTTALALPTAATSRSAAPRPRADRADAELGGLLTGCVEHDSSTTYPSTKSCVFAASC